MIISLLWIACSVIVFRHTFKYLIKEELDTWGELDTDTFILHILLSTTLSLFGPIAILAYIIYNILKAFSESIAERYKNDTR